MLCYLYKDILNTVSAISTLMREKEMVVASSIGLDTWL